jgi:hypothetical protein
MARRIACMLLGWGMLGLASGVLVPAASGAEWYPFYGYHRPSYLGQACVVYAQPAAVVTVEPAAPVASAQPAATQGSTGYYVPAAVTTPAPGSVAPVQSVAPQPYQYQYQYRNNGGGWYPFYGYRRPSYLDR